MVLRKFRFRTEPPVGVRDASACRAGDGGLVRRDRACAIACDEDAMYLLARAALAGEGMGQDIEEGHEMMREAASRGCELAIDEYPETERLFRQWDAARQKRDAVLRMACRIGIGFLLAGAVLLAGVGFAIRKRPAA